MAVTTKSNIWQHWQPIVGIAGFLIAMGGFYSETKTMRKDISNLESRQDRQFQLYQEVQKNVAEIQKKESYNEGYHKAMDELKK